MASRAIFGDVSSDEDWSGLLVLAGLLELSVRWGDVPSTEKLVARLESMAGRLKHDFLTSFGRLLGEGAVLLGRPAQARDFYAQAVGICEKVRFRPELALTRLDLAELLLVHYPDAADDERSGATHPTIIEDWACQPCRARPVRWPRRESPLDLRTLLTPRGNPRRP